MGTTVFWVGLAVLGLPMGLWIVGALVDGEPAIDVLTAVLVKLLSTGQHERFHKMLRVFPRSTSSELARRAFELRDSALTSEGGAVGYRDKALVSDFSTSLQKLLEPELAKQQRRVLVRYLPTVLGFSAPVWLWVAHPESRSGPIVATLFVVLGSVQALRRARMKYRGLETMVQALTPLLDPRRNDSDA